MADLLRCAVQAAAVVAVASVLAILTVGAPPYPLVTAGMWAAGTLYLWGSR